jgi:DNA-binding response OmpR family regulator
MDAMRVLVVEDNSVIADAVAEGLRDERMAARAGRPGIILVLSSSRGAAINWYLLPLHFNTSGQ